MNTLTDLLIAWGSINAIVVLVAAPIAHYRGAVVPRDASNNVGAGAERMQLAQRHESQ